MSKTLVSLVFPSVSTFMSTTTLNYCQKPQQAIHEEELRHKLRIMSLGFSSLQQTITR
jgi:hypothetical protein